eukprot:TRINITY_DN4234_c0_g1_i2.p1 TRINITY_DN4234_c0_g1~~TRINITY_DN4234_c0_g1_i2.p1  ORF type:complete len:496 (-),score=65.76 TRINITY_DN4234_c0_g1_i2:25-1512(-)
MHAPTQDDIANWVQPVLQFMAESSCYRFIPDSSRCVVLDLDLPITAAFAAAADNDVTFAALWDRDSQQLCGMLTVTDYARILLCYFTNLPALGLTPVRVLSLLDALRIRDWRAHPPPVPSPLPIVGASVSHGAPAPDASIPVRDLSARPSTASDSAAAPTTAQGEVAKGGHGDAIAGRAAGGTNVALPTFGSIVVDRQDSMSAVGAAVRTVSFAGPPDDAGSGADDNRGGAVPSAWVPHVGAADVAEPAAKATAPAAAGATVPLQHSAHVLSEEVANGTQGGSARAQAAQAIPWPMRRGFVHCSADTSALQALLVMRRDRVNHLPVVAAHDSGRLLHVLTYTQLLAGLAARFPMAHSPLMRIPIHVLGIGVFDDLATCPADAPLERLLAVMLHRKVSALPITAPGAPRHVVDVFSRYDILHLASTAAYDLARPYEALAAARPRTALFTCSPDDPLGAVIGHFARTGPSLWLGARWGWWCVWSPLVLCSVAKGVGW